MHPTDSRSINFVPCKKPPLWNFIKFYKRPRNDSKSEQNSTDSRPKKEENSITLRQFQSKRNKANYASHFQPSNRDLKKINSIAIKRAEKLHDLPKKPSPLNLKLIENQPIMKTMQSTSTSNPNGEPFESKCPNKRTKLPKGKGETQHNNPD